MLHSARICAVSFLALQCFSGQANASLINEGSVVLDTGTGLEWNKIPNTGGYSYNAMLPELADGRKFQGWSFATGAQMQQLFDDAGIPTWSGTDPTSYANVRSFADIFGLMYETYGTGTCSQPATNFGTVCLTTGMYGSPISPLPWGGPLMLGAGILYYADHIEYQVDRIAIDASHLPTQYGGFYLDSAATSYLVRQASKTVPEPNNAILMAIGGFAALVCLVRQKPM